MSDRDAFIRHIADHPHADLPRLVFADWLDERDDPLGLFIRTQIELDPIRDQIESPRVRELLAVEDQLLSEHEEMWLQPIEGILPKRGSYAGPHLRRGLPHAICLSAQALCEHGDRLMEAFPTVRELAVHELDELGGLGGEVGDHPFLGRVDVLELASLPERVSFSALCGSRLFGKQPTIRLWNGGFGTCPLFGIAPEQWKPSGTVEYVQLLGGVMAGLLRDAYDQEADECAAEFNAVWGEGTVRVVRPYLRTFPIHEEDETFPCGRFPDGRFGLVFFGIRDEQVSIADFKGMRHVGTRYLQPPILGGWDEWMRQHLQPPKIDGWDGWMRWLRDDLRLARESIRVHQFRTERMYGVQLWPERWVAELDQGHFTEWDRMWEWLHNRRYSIEGMGGHWADYRGFVTDS